MKVYKVVHVLPSGHRVSAYASGAWAHVYPPLGTVEARKGKLFVFRRRLDARRWLQILCGADWQGVKAAHSFSSLKILRATSHDSREPAEMAARYQKDFRRHWAGKLPSHQQRPLPAGTLLVSSLQLLE